MGIFESILKGLISETASQQGQRRRYPTPEESIIIEQERSGETWHGVPLCELSKLAQTVRHGKYVKADGSSYLLFRYTSNSNKTPFDIQCKLDENGKLTRCFYNYYPNQWKDSADDFIKAANQKFTFI